MECDGSDAEAEMDEMMEKSLSKAGTESKPLIAAASEVEISTDEKPKEMNKLSIDPVGHGLLKAPEESKSNES